MYNPVRYDILQKSAVRVTYLWVGVILYQLVDEQADLIGPISTAVRRY